VAASSGGDVAVFATNAEEIVLSVSQGELVATVPGLFGWVPNLGNGATKSWGLGRLRPGGTPIVTAIAARSCTEGVILEFAEPIDPASLKLQNISARGWNYFRSAAYGSGRYKLGVLPSANEPGGTMALGIAQLVLSADGRSIFVHLPHLPSMMQLEIRHDFRFTNGFASQGAVYFTINQPHPLDLAAAGFPKLDLTKTETTITTVSDVAPTPAVGRVRTETLACVACHSSDGSTAGKIGPTWKGVFGSVQVMADGSRQRVDEFFVREKILDPTKRRVTTASGEMPSDRGVVTDAQLEALVLYIKSLAGAPPAESESNPK
jgi:mono/diheme cytochrome c family protein